MSAGDDGSSQDQPTQQQQQQQQQQSPPRDYNPTLQQQQQQQQQPQQQPNWEPYLRHTSALGILKPNVVFDVFKMSAGGDQRLPNPRVVRTAHADDGKSVFVSDELVTPFHPFGPEGSGFSVLDVRPAVPVRNTDPPVQAAAAAAASQQPLLPRCPPAGVNFVITDIPPGRSAPMHRTLSLDYAAVMAGEVVLRLDGGEEKTVRAGELIVQQGVNHEWENRGDETCRILFVMVGSEKITLADGRALEETVFQR
ncbi:uncharacterized protein E0L32_007565 [Thyridium curvatum]|uniref:Cupin type-2 domain-containing protein n=1 Tax=Thyridium curvatum TaxID=1093900 RepID=A0A507B4N4_9PEZI|nr:uncharacterized protein E0L32_007565 [Thyridium curvatum]TPX11828.1 hypothetical protein E0L32_007565 [Thyridium curvatum]